jgi:hypothetical protein
MPYQGPGHTGFPNSSLVMAVFPPGGGDDLPPAKLRPPTHCGGTGCLSLRGLYPENHGPG